MVNTYNCGVADTDPAWHCLTYSGKTQYSINRSTVSKMWEEKKILEIADFSVHAISVCYNVLDTSCNIGNKQRASINANKIKD